MEYTLGWDLEPWKECAEHEHAIVNTKFWVKTHASHPLHGWFLSLTRKNWPLYQYSMIVADLPVSCVFAIPSLWKKSMSVLSFKRRICYLLYLASWRRRTAIFAFHKFAKRKVFSTHRTHSMAFHWQPHIWISCHISLESRRAGRRRQAHEWGHWLSCSSMGRHGCFQGASSLAVTT